MGTDFFDGLVKTFSKTTKELGKTTRELGARAEQTIEAQKIRSKITGEERIIEKIKVDIGDIVYRRHSQGDGLDYDALFTRTAIDASIFVDFRMHHRHVGKI